MYSVTILLSLLGALRVLASPITQVAPRSVTGVSISALDGFAPYTQFARAAYCGTAKVKNWNCGQACAANADFTPTLTGGDGNAIPYFFVGYWPSQSSIVVAHEGTDPTQFLSLLTDANISMAPLDPSLFPGVPNVKVHEGFRNSHQATASQILQEVKTLISSKGSTQVITVGHSLGGALAELDSLFFKLNLDSSVSVKAVTYGTPRVGDPNYAAFFDQTVSNFQRINNEKDPIPTVPGRFLGFSHVHGEIHIIQENNAVACSGDDDATDSQCTISTVPNVFDSNILNHLGPYQGISIGTIFCT